MALDDLIDREIGLAVLATAAAVSPRARDVLHRGAVYGLAGAMKAGDVVYGAARGAVRGAADGVSGNGSPARATRRSSTASTPRSSTASTPRSSTASTRRRSSRSTASKRNG